jgi:transcriptional regulator GlxA family with amidase domain
MSPQGFSRFFRRYMGRSFVSYVCELRVGRACRLLLETDQTVSQVCWACGFTNLSNFNRRFRMLKGLAPREYRRGSKPIET